MLPEYLRFDTSCAPALPECTVAVQGARFTILTSRLIRLEQGPVTDAATLSVICRRLDTPTFSREERDGLVTLRTDHLELRYRPGQAFSAESLEIRSLAAPFFRWRWGEKPLRNLGGTVSTLDEVNGACPLEDGVCSQDGYALIDDSATALFTPEGWFEPRTPGCTDVYFFGYGHDYVSAVKDYCRLTGAPGLLPAFALGNWWSRYHKYTDQEYLGLMDAFRRKDVPLSVGVVDMDWHLTDGDGRSYWEDGWTGYTWNEKLFPDYRAFLQALHEKGLHTALNLHPALGVRSHEIQYPAVCEALGVDPASGKAVPFDCLNPAFLKAYFEILHFPYEQDGVDFWWMDWQQGTDYSWIHPPEGEKNPLECITPLWLLNHMHYLASQRAGKRGFVFSRFAGAGSQRYPIGFSGDTVISWDSLRFQPYFTATASNAGYGWWSHDIGGHMQGVRDDELTARWVQFGVFSPIFRLHSTQNPFASREPWAYNPRAEAVMSNMMRLRHRMFPYLYTMNRRAAQELIPLMQPMYHTHPECPAAYETPNQYWFGSEMVVCPITAPADAVSGLGCAEGWLPEGRWVDFFTGYVYRGGEKLRFHRPLETLPVLLKAGGIVPLQAHVPQDNTLGGSRELEIVVAAGASGDFTLYEDDGESLRFMEGGFCTTRFTLDWAEDGAVFTIHQPQGDASLIPAGRRYRVTFRGFRPGCGCDQPWTYDAAANSYTLVTDGPCTLRLRHPECLLHDNSDWRVRSMDVLTRAQCSFAQKDLYLKRLDRCLREPDKLAYILHSDLRDRTADALLELVSQGL